MRNGKKRSFKTLFELSRCDFRFPDYRRAKKKVIFGRLLGSFARISPPRPIKFQTSDRRDDSWKDVVRVPRKNI